MGDPDHPFRPEEAEPVESAEDGIDADDPPCQIDGCDRPGTVPRTVDHADGELVQRYVCRYHRRLFVAVKAGVVLLAVALFLVAFFQLY